MLIVSYKLWKKYGDDKELSDVLIPEYEPPKGLSPEEVGFLNNKGQYDPKQLAALITSLAIQKIIKIEKLKKDEYKLTLLKSDEQTLNSLSQNQKIFLTAFTRNKLDINDLDDAKALVTFIMSKMLKPEERKILQKSEQEENLSITIGVKYLKYLESIRTSIEKNIKSKVLDMYYKHNHRLLISPIILGIISILLAITTLSDIDNLVGNIVPPLIWGFIIFRFFKGFVQNKGYKKISSVFAYIFAIAFIYIIFQLGPSSLNSFNFLFNLSPETLALLIIISVIVLVYIDFLAFKTRTTLGTQAQNRIEGLKHFLTKTEKHRYESALHE